MSSSDTETEIESAAVAEAPVPVKKPELIDRVVADSGIKKKDAKPVIEATLAALGALIAEGRDLNLPLLGKVKITNTKEVGANKIVTLRLRRPAEGPAGEGQEDAPDEVSGEDLESATQESYDARHG